MIQFSVVIPLYNKNDHIIKALESVKKQTYKSFEVLIIDDGSTDNSHSTVLQWINKQKSGPKIKLISQKNHGASAARNRGVSESIYPYIAFLDADDYWQEDHLQNLMYLINKYANTTDLFSNGIILQIDQKMKYPNLGNYDNFVGVVDYFLARLISSGFINSSSACVTKKAIQKNPFPQDMKNFEDYTTWAKIANNKGMAFSSKRTVVNVVDNSEASSSISFESYIKFEHALRFISCDKLLLDKYIKKILLINILGARLRMPYRSYMIEALKMFGKSKIVTAYTMLGFVIPKFVLSFLRNRRIDNSTF